MRVSSLMIVALLAGCGGGELPDLSAVTTVVVECQVQGACSVNGNDVTITVPAPPATAPDPAPDPTTNPPPDPAPSATPLAGVRVPRPGASPLYVPEGSLRWCAQGSCYAVVTSAVADVAFVSIFYCPANPCDPATGAWSIDSHLDDALDMHHPLGLQQYVATYIVPPLDAWMRARMDRWASGMTLMPVSSAPIPAEWPTVNKVAASIPQRVELTPFGAMLR